MIEIKGCLPLMNISDRYPKNLEELTSLVGKPIKDNAGNIIGKITRIDIREGCFYGVIEDKSVSTSLLADMGKVSMEVKEDEQETAVE